ncbi:unnamed protein product, partial [marine sediment metagenome]
TDLAVSDLGVVNHTLTWTATGSSADSGIASVYDLRYSTALIDSANFSSATPVTNIPDPATAGVTETFKITQLLPSTTYYFAIRASDYFVNYSLISNVVSAQTLDPPIISVAPNSFNESLTLCKDSITLPMTIYNTGLSDLTFNIIDNAYSEYDSTSTQYYSTTNATTNHYFTELESDADSIYLIITINGDFDLPEEYLDIYVDGSTISQINPTEDDTDISYIFALGGSNVANWLSDGQITVTLDNSLDVGTGYGTMLHQVQLIIHTYSRINLSADAGTVV